VAVAAGVAEWLFVRRGLAVFTASPVSRMGEGQMADRAP
jgi:hypothetical protein